MATVRILLLVATSAIAAVGSACLDRMNAPDTRQPARSLAIQEENLRTGSPDWDAELYTGVDSTISGYGLPFSLYAGDTLHVFVTVKHAPVSVSIYRLGWDQGGGPRLIARPGGLPAPDQPRCPPPL